jgi:hypothetical protein
MEIKLIIRATAPGGQKVFTMLDEPASLEITEQLKQPTTFTLTYADDICNGDYITSPQYIIGPFSEIEIWVQIDSKAFCLVKGLVQSQQIKLVHGGQGSQVQVSGTDNSIRMSWSTETKNWKNKIDANDIIFMLSTVRKSKKGRSLLRNFTFKKYVILGFGYNVSLKEDADVNGDLEESDLNIEPDPGLPKPAEENTPDTDRKSLTLNKEQIQKGDDLAFIRQLADQKGKYFWVSYDDDGEEIAHFDDLPLKNYDKIAEGEYPVLKINLENNDIDEFTISWDADRPTSVVSEHTDPRTKEIIEVEVPIAPQPKLGNVNLTTMTYEMINAFQWSTVSDVIDLKERGDSALNEAEWFIKASCSTSYDRLCKNFNDKNPVRIFHAHEMIMIEGAGMRHSGPYLVSGVTHSINAGSYKVQLQLLRNAWVDTNHKGFDLTPEPEEETSNAD